MLTHLAPLLFYVLAQLAGPLADPFMRDLPALAWSIPDRPADIVGRASTYGRAKDSHRQAFMAAAEHVRLDDRMHVVAHRTLPHGTILLIQSTRTGRTTLAVSRDRGPYGCEWFDPETGEIVWLNLAILKKRKDPRAATCVPRGVLDLAPAVRAALGPDGSTGGLQPVRAWIISRPKRSQYVRRAGV